MSRSQGTAKLSKYIRFLVVSVCSGVLVSLLTAGPAWASSSSVTEPKRLRANNGTAAALADCGVRAYVDHVDRHARLFGAGYTTCRVDGGAMGVSIWRDGKRLAYRASKCTPGSNCASSSPSVSIIDGRHRYCARAAYYLHPNELKTPTAVDWSCGYY